MIGVRGRNGATSYYSLFATHHLLLTTYFSPLTTHRVPLTAHYLPLTCYHLPLYRRPVYYVTLLSSLGHPPSGLPYTIEPAEAGCAVLRPAGGGVDLTLCDSETQSVRF